MYTSIYVYINVYIYISCIYIYILYIYIYIISICIHIPTPWLVSSPKDKDPHDTPSGIRCTAVPERMMKGSASPQHESRLGLPTWWFL